MVLEAWLKPQMSKEDKMKQWFTKPIIIPQGIYMLLLIVFFAMDAVLGTVTAVVYEASAQDARPTQLSARQMQSYCVGGDTACDVENFEALDNGHTVHFVSPDPISETLQGSWNQHCPKFSDLPSYVRVSVLNLQTMEMQSIDQTGSLPVCEAYFTFE